MASLALGSHGKWWEQGLEGQVRTLLASLVQSTLLTCCFTSARALALRKWWEEGLEGQGLKLPVHEALSY